MEKQASKSVVGDVKIPKIKMTGTRAAIVNAVSVIVATYFGGTAIFCAIAGFTGGAWVFEMSSFLSLLPNYGSPASYLLLSVVLALIGGILAFTTLRKLTDANAVKKTWNVVGEIFCVVGGLLAVSALASLLFSLLGIGDKTINQAGLWLNVFLPTFVRFVMAAVIALVAKGIAGGKLSHLKIFSIVSSCVAAVAFVLVLVQLMISFYGKLVTVYTWSYTTYTPSTSSSRYLDDDDDYDWSDWYDLFNY